MTIKQKKKIALKLNSKKLQFFKIEQMRSTSDTLHVHAKMNSKHILSWHFSRRALFFSPYKILCLNPEMVFHLSCVNNYNLLMPDQLIILYTHDFNVFFFSNFFSLSFSVLFYLSEIEVANTFGCGVIVELLFYILFFHFPFVSFSSLLRLLLMQ